MDDKKNSHRLSDIDKKIGIVFRVCIICKKEFQVLRKQEYKICPYCLMREENKNA